MGMTDERAFSIARSAVNDHEAAQKIEELAALISFLNSRGAPKVVVEIGSFKGGTLWAWRQAFPEAKIIAIDPVIHCPPCDRRAAHSNCPRDRVRQNATVYLPRRSDDPQVLNALPVLTGSIGNGGGIGFHFIDGDHSPEAVDNDFAKYSPHTAADGVVALHDILAPAATLPGDGRPSDGVMKFWANVKMMIPQAFEIATEPLDWGGIGVIPRFQNA